jgi:hypothetical protein
VRRRYILISLATIVMLQFQTSCFYKKVILTTEEKQMIPYGTKKSRSVFRNGDKLDTVIFHNHNGYRKGYLPNFDLWWDRKIRNDSLKKRPLYLSLNASSNFPQSSDHDLNLYLNIHFTKRHPSDKLSLWIEDFGKEKILDNTTKDTLVFDRTDVGRPCKSCVTKVIWKTDRGVIQLIKNDSSIWTRID